MTACKWCGREFDGGYPSKPFCSRKCEAEDPDSSFHLESYEEQREKHREEDERRRKAEEARRDFQGWEGWIAWFFLLPASIAGILGLFGVVPGKRETTDTENILGFLIFLAAFAWGIYWAWLDRKEHGGKSLTENRGPGGCCIMPFLIFIVCGGMAQVMDENGASEGEQSIVFIPMILLIIASIRWGWKQSTKD